MKTQRVDALTTATYAWCAHESLKLIFVPHSTPWLMFCVLLVAITAMRPSPGALMFALIVRCMDAIARMPTIWDSWYWTLQVDGGFTILLLYFAGRHVAGRRTMHKTDRDMLAEWWSTTTQYQLSQFYLAAAFWKINTSFFDARTSCAPIFVLSLLPTLGVHPPAEAARVLALAAPAITIGGEAAIGLMLLSRRRHVVCCGTALALLLHVGITLTPSPNNATPFSLSCAVKLLIVHAEAAGVVLGEVACGRAKLTATLAAAAAALFPGIVYARAASFPPDVPPAVDWFVAMYGLLAPIVLRAVLHPAPHRTQADPKAPRAPPALRRALVVVAAVYGFGGPLLGVQDLGSCNMYSNLRMYGGSNHYLVPTSVLGKLLPAATEAFTVVRVEKTTSAWMNSIYPGEITTLMAPWELRSLREAGHGARMFNGMKARILGPDKAAADAPMSPYTVPAIELRRLLAEARERAEPFFLTYTVLDGEGDEAWRRSAAGRTVTIEEDGKGFQRCIYRCGVASLFTCVCEADEIGLLPPPGYLASKFLIAQPYPIVAEAEEFEGELICFGP